MARGETAPKYQLVLTPKAERNLKQFDRHVIERVAQSIDALVEQPRLGKTLKGRFKGKRSLRVGDYRVIYSHDPERRQVIVEKVGHRRNIYS